jgi:hypothetical protein
MKLNIEPGIGFGVLWKFLDQLREVFLLRRSPNYSRLWLALIT